MPVLSAERIIVFLIGLAAGAGACWLLLAFPGGRGEGERLSLSFREGQEYRVQRVVDGDTIVLEPGIYLRYAGVDTPETRQVIDVQRPFGPEASEANRELVEGRSVRLRFGPRKMDIYGRLLASIEVRGDDGAWIDVGEELARRGLARQLIMPDRAPNAERVGRAADEAKEAGRGIWSRSGAAAAERK